MSSRLALIWLEVLLAVGAVGGAFGLITGTLDLGEYTDDLPWQSPLIAGIALLVVNGVLPAAVALGELRRRRWAGVGHLVVGSALIGWVAVQVAFIGANSFLQLVYLAYGIVIVVLARSRRRRRMNRPARLRRCNCNTCSRSRSSSTVRRCSARSRSASGG
jgi:hypothetical protein